MSPETRPETSVETRRQWLSSILALGLFAPIGLARAGGRPASAIRMRWPFPVAAPRPYALDDLVSALVGPALFPPLYRRAPDGYLEPNLALGMPKEVRGPRILPLPDRGLRVDLPTHIRPGDVANSISAAKVEGARLHLREVPIPRVDGASSVLFPGLTDGDALARKLCSPLTGIARFGPLGVLPTGPFDLRVDMDTTAPTRKLQIVRQKPAIVVPTPSKVLVRPTAKERTKPSPPPPITMLRHFELEGPVDVASGLRDFERGDTDVGFLGDGLYERRSGSRPMDFGLLAYVVIQVGDQAGGLRDPGALLEMIDGVASDRLDHLGLLRRDFTAPPPSEAVRVAPPRPPAGARWIVRSTLPTLVSAAEVLASELGGKAVALDPETYAKVIADRSYALSIDVLRPIDETVDAVSMSLATLTGATSAPISGLLPRAWSAEGRAVLAYEIPLVGAQSGSVWIPRGTSGGFDLDGAGEA